MEIPPNANPTYIVCYNWVPGLIMSYFGNPDCTPTSGEDATPPGKAGNGGNGGIIFTLGSTSFFTDNSGGEPGKSRRDEWPYDTYLGGDPGWPVTFSQLTIWWSLTWPYYGYSFSPPDPYNKTEYGTHEPVKPGTPGTDGSTINAEDTYYSQEYSWLHPLLVRRVVDHAKALYLAGDIDSTRETLEQYADTLRAYIADHEVDADDKGIGSYDQIEEDWQRDLEILYHEIETILHRIASLLDYFGNPQGWVPMVSFEVTNAMFETEIERASNIIGLSQWLIARADNWGYTYTNFINTREYLWGEFEADKVEYNELVTSALPSLLSKGNELKTKTIDLQHELQARETYLLNHLYDDENQLLKGIEIGTRLSLKTAAILCKAIPIPEVQPMLGDLGGGILQLASNIEWDAEEWDWDNLFELPDLATSYTNSKFEDATKTLQEKIDGVDAYTDETEKVAYWESVRQITSAVSDGVSDIRSYIEELYVSEEEVTEKLNELKELDDSYQDIVEEIETHLEVKAEHAHELADVMQQISILANRLDEDIMAIDSLKSPVALKSLSYIEPRTMGYLKSVEQDAYDRLLKYHYYLAKAYEYRTLTSYNTSLNLQDLHKNLSALANAEETTLENLIQLVQTTYEPIIDTLANDIYQGYVDSGAQESESDILVSLNQEELDALNTGDTVKINIWERYNNDYIEWYEDAVRIVNLTINDIETEPSANQDAKVSFTIIHSGISNLRIGDQIYQFRHCSEDTKAEIMWKNSYFPNAELSDDNPKVDGPSEASDSLLKSLLGNNAPDDMLLYSRPSAWADLDMTKVISGTQGEDINITKLQLRMSYDYVPNSNNDPWEIHVFPCLSSSYGSQISPHYIVSQVDSNGRKDGERSFQRFYPFYIQNPVSITAQEKVGNWRFYKWLDRYENELEGGPFTDPTIELLPNETLPDGEGNDWLLCAAYQYDVEDPTDTDGDGIPDEIENAACTDPYDADTDDDGIPDGVEDENHDGIVSSNELDPCNVNTDGDRYQDGTELGYSADMVGADTDLFIFVADTTPYSITNPFVNPAEVIPTIISTLLLLEE